VVRERGHAGEKIPKGNKRFPFKGKKRTQNLQNQISPKKVGFDETARRGSGGGIARGGSRGGTFPPRKLDGWFRKKKKEDAFFDFRGIREALSRNMNIEEGITIEGIQ